MRHGHGQPQRHARQSSGRAAAARRRTRGTSAHTGDAPTALHADRPRLRTSHLIPVLVTTSPDCQALHVFPLSAGLATYLQSRASRRLSLYSLGRGRLQSQQSLYCCTRTHTLFPLHSRAHHGEARAAPPSVLVAGRTKLSCRALASARALCAASSQLTHGCCCRCCLRKFARSPHEQRSPRSTPSLSGQSGCRCSASSPARLACAPADCT